MQENLSITFVQARLAWEQREANYAHLQELLRLAGDTGDLILLPEMFTTGFTMNPEAHAEPAGGPTPLWMQELAAERQAVVVGSYSCKDGDRFVNRLLAVGPEGVLCHYDKRHLFRMAQEHKHYAAGESKIVFEYKGWKICPMVCYDLRFPVWVRNRFDENGTADYDLLLFVANWPHRRVHHWKLLLQARAVENLCYVAGVNRFGDDGNAIYHSGDSLLADAQGAVIATASHAESVFTARINADKLAVYRRAFPAWKDADSFNIQ